MQYQRWIGISQLDESKVGKKSTLDFIITIGRDEAAPNSRFLYVPKNKIGPQTMNRHMRKEVIFCGERARYEDPITAKDYSHDIAED